MTARFNRRELAEKCAVIERHVRHRHLATDIELIRYRPGGEENPARTLDGLVYWYAQLVRFAGRQSEYGTGDHEAADAAVLDALRQEPLLVELVRREASTPRQVIVHPKGLDALLQAHAQDWILGWLARHLDRVQASGDHDGGDLVVRVLAEIAYQYALLTWIVTHPGPGLPFPALTERPAPPADCSDLDAWDYLRVAQAHQVVNAQRLQGLQALIAPDLDGDEATARRPSWSSFVGVMAVKMQKQPRDLMRDFSLAETLAMIQLHGASERDAHERAKAAAAGAEG